MRTNIQTCSISRVSCVLGHSTFFPETKFTNFNNLLICRKLITRARCCTFFARDSYINANVERRPNIQTRVLKYLLISIDLSLQTISLAATVLYHSASFFRFCHRNFKKKFSRQKRDCARIDNKCQWQMTTRETKER